MRIRAVIMIVGVHDAHNTAGRLTASVPDKNCRVEAITLGLGRGRRQPTPALLGVG
jgi:hypothetical protein